MDNHIILYRRRLWSFVVRYDKQISSGFQTSSIKVSTCPICRESKISCLSTMELLNIFCQGPYYCRKMWICLLLATHTMKTRLNFTLHQNMSGIYYHSTLAMANSSRKWSGSRSVIFHLTNHKLIFLFLFLRWR